MTCELRPLEEVVDDILDRRGVTPFKLGGDFTSSGHRVISAKLVKGGRVDLGADEPRFVDASIYKKWMKNPLQPGDVIMTSEAPLGELAYLDDSRDWVLGQRLFALRPNKKVLCGKFLYYALATPDVRERIAARASGTTVQGIRQAELRKVDVPVPPLKVQIEAATILSSLDDRLDNLRQTNATLEAIAQALFKSWFVDFDPVRAKAEGRKPEGMDAPTAALFPSGFEESELGPIPNGWSCSRFGELLAERSERVRTQEAIVMSAVQSGKLVRSDDHFNKRVHSADISKYKLVQPLSFAYNPSRINIGSIGLNEGGAIGAVSPIYVVAKATRSDVAYFVWHHLRTEAMKRRIVGLCSGSVRQSLSAADFFSLPIAIPDARLLSIFHSVRQSLYDKFRSNESQASLLADMRDTLLPRLISGKLRLPEVEAEVEAVA